MPRLLFSAAFCLLYLYSPAQIDHAGSGRAISLDGIDDYVDLGNIYDDVALPVTLSVWVKVDPSITALVPIFDSQDGSSVYNGFAVVASHVHFGMTYGDGMGGNNPAYRRSKAALYGDPTGHWVNVTAVFRDKVDMDIYVNGIDAGGSYEGSSDMPMNSNSPSEVARVGKWLSNGILYQYKGVIDELRIWNRALSATEVRDYMCRKLAGNEPGLIGYWNFDETSGTTVYDKSPNGYNGQLMNGAQRVYSGAPVGDASVNLYATSLAGQSLSMTVGAEKFTAKKIQGSAKGIQLYVVNELPSQTQGLDLAEISAPYFGVFTAGLDDNSFFDVEYTVNGVPVCGGLQRNDNSVASWASGSTNPITLRTEMIKQMKVDLDVDMGPDKQFCDQPSATLRVPPAFAGRSVLWNTGETTTSITVKKSGMYWLFVGGDCNGGRDTVKLTFATAPPAVSLGPDKTLCAHEELVLRPVQNAAGLAFEWHDGSTDSIFNVTDFGKFSVTIRNACGESSDSLNLTKFTFDKNKIPNVITPGNDNLNEHFMVEDALIGASFSVFNRWGQAVYTNPSYHNEWAGEGLASGVYYYTLQGDCVGKIKGNVYLLKGD